MNNILLISFCLILITACQSSPELQEGKWTGHLSPMNHPDMTIPISIKVRYNESGLNISITGSNGVPATTRNPRIKGDSLFFVFNEPEGQVRLECALARNNTNGFSGKCMDPSGKWAKFTMTPPK